MAEARTLGEWVLLPLLCRPEAAPLRALAETEIDRLYVGEDSPLASVFSMTVRTTGTGPVRPRKEAETAGESRRV